MSYDKEHTIDHCDKCNALVGKDKLRRLSFLYLDKNDNVHLNQGNDYRQYYICNNCAYNEYTIKNNKSRGKK